MTASRGRRSRRQYRKETGARHCANLCQRKLQRLAQAQSLKQASQTGRPLLRRLRRRPPLRPVGKTLRLSLIDFAIGGICG